MSKIESKLPSKQERIMVYIQKHHCSLKDAQRQIAKEDLLAYLDDVDTLRDLKKVLRIVIKELI